MLDNHTRENEYSEISPPLIVNEFYNVWNRSTCLNLKADQFELKLDDV